MYEKHVEFILCLWENVASVAYLEGRLKSRSYGNLLSSSLAHLAHSTAGLLAVSL